MKAAIRHMDDSRIIAIPLSGSRWLYTFGLGQASAERRALGRVEYGLAQCKKCT